MAVAYLNGEWLPINEAKVSVMDRGFLFGDGVYEVIPVYDGKLFCLDRHIQRLQNSLAEISLDLGATAPDWHLLLQEAVQKSGESLAALYMQVTRGPDNIRSFVYPETLRPTIFIMVSPAPLLARTCVTPQNLITLEDFRWRRGHIKTISLIAAGMLKNQAVAAGASDAILHKEGVVTECTASNVFVVLDGVLVTPPKSSDMLHGITRDVVVELAKAGGIAVEERNFTPGELKSAEEIFITSSTQETWPVGSVDGAQVGNGEPGLVWQAVDQLFQREKLSMCN